MFITHANFASPIGPIANTKTTQHWSAVELAFDFTWFMMRIQKIDPMDNSIVHDTLLIEDLESAVQLVEHGSTGPVQLKSVYSITPDYANDSGQWRMDLVKALWVAEHPDKKGWKVEICEMASGQKFVTSNFGPLVGDLTEQTLKCQFPV